jgi:hypothetical protein
VLFLRFIALQFSGAVGSFCAIGDAGAVGALDAVGALLAMLVLFL